MRNRQGIQKSSLVEEESDMKRNEFEALTLLRRRVKEMRANGEMDAQHDACAATLPQEPIEVESRDFKSSFCEFQNKRVKCRNVGDLSGKQNEGREWVKNHFMPWAEASFRWIYEYICLYVYIHIYIYVYMYKYTHIYIYVYVHIYIYIYTHIYLYIHIYMCTYI